MLDGETRRRAALAGRGRRRARRASAQSSGDIIVLVDLGEFSYADAAQILDVPIGTVMSRLHRGRRILKQALAEESLT